MALGLIQPLTEMSTRGISGSKGNWCIGLTTMPPSFADCLEIMTASTCSKPKGLYRDCCTSKVLKNDSSLLGHYGVLSGEYVLTFQRVIRSRVQY